MLQIVRRGLLGLALLVALLVGALALVVVLGLPLSLNALRPSLVAAASEILGREVEIRGDIHLVPALWPTLGARRVRVADPDGFEGGGDYFARFEKAHGQVDLLALLRGELRIGEVSIEAAHFALATTADGRNNWAFRGDASGPDAAGRELLEIRSLLLDDVQISYREGATGRDYQLGVEALEGSLSSEEMELSIEGRVGQHEISLDLRTDLLSEMSQLYEPWELDVDGVVAGIPLTGRALFDVRTYDSRAELELHARKSDVGELIEMLSGRTGVEGRFERLSLRAATSGHDLHQWIKFADARFELAGGALSYGNASGARPVGFTLDEAGFELVPDGGVVGRARGSLLDEPVQLSLSGGPAVNLLDGAPWPLAIEGAGAGATFGLSGLARARSDAGAPHELQFAIEGDRLGGLASWLGVPAGAPSPYALRGELALAADATTFSVSSFSLGRTRGRGSIQWRHAEQVHGPRVSLEMATLDPQELDNNLDPELEGSSEGAPGLTIDTPVLPQQIAIQDADLDIRVGRVYMDPADVMGVAFSAQVRDSRVEGAPFRARFAGVDFDGDLDLDLAGEVPAAALRLATGAVDVGDLAQALGFASNLNARAARFSLDLRLRGGTGRQLLAGAAFEAVAEDGVWLVDTDLLNEEVRFQRVSWYARPRSRVGSEFEGELRSVPIFIQAELPALLDWVVPDYVFPARIRVEAAGAQLDLVPRLSFPIRHMHGDLGFKLAGERLSDLGPLLGVELPPFGPYSVMGKLDRRAAGYDATYDLRVRDSRLSGTTRVDTTGSKPRVVAELEAPNVQLADFRYAGEPLLRAESASPSDAEETLARVKPFLSHDVLGAFNAEASLRVDEVRSGGDSLGRGSLQATLQDGRLVLDPFDLDFPGGEVALVLAVEPGPDDVEVSLRARIDRFDYGVLARRLDAQSRARGRMSLSADLEAHGPDLATLSPGASGWVEIAVRPERLDASFLELWATNILRSMLRLVSPFSGPTVNCAVGAFEIDQGVLESRAILVDTRAMQVLGSGYTDFRTGALRFEFRPRPKRSEVLSLALPVVAEGTIQDVRTRLRPENPVRAVARQVRNTIRIPFERLFGRRPPADGRPACLAALEAARDGSGRAGAPLGSALLRCDSPGSAECY